MILSEKQLSKDIRVLQWKLKEYNGKLYRTTLTMSDTKLFWIDFLRNIFAPLFARQRVITRLPAFDTSQPVLLEDSTNDLYLSTQFESVVYYSQNKDSPACVFLPPFDINSITALLVAIIIIVLILFASIGGSGGVKKTKTTTTFIV